MTTYSDEDLVDESISAGPKEFVKDIERFALKQAIRAVQRGEGFIAPSVTGRIRLVAEGFSKQGDRHQVHLSENTVWTVSE